ncbi:nucleotide exchange factor GrpE [Lichenihabitans psoromatis]|uniref:nucleotide exchange factor GrpE n=1 Tax=Lichenihabitans psoromatis TaxID=2528642 RepID=UPI001036B889|nr:nucleotide exchange factor GrpE [Lichenihabitans psoromatis]
MMIDPNADPIDPVDDAAAQHDERAQTQGAAGEPDPFVVLENLTAENATLKDKVLRTMAEMENVRRRTDKEVADSKLYGVSNFAREMLAVADNLHRAIASLPAEARAGSEAVKTLVEGVELTERDLLSRLARFNVRPIEPEGKKFDPNLHEVLFEVPDESMPSGTVKQVVETGYTIGDRVLRAAKVGVSRGGPKVN